MKVKDKIIVVTGGGSGIGRALVLHLLEKGAKVAAVDINEQTLQETVSLAGASKDNISVYRINITERESVEALPQQVIGRFGVIDGLINCAGIIQPFVTINALDYDVIDRVMRVNFYGTLYMVKSFLPHLLERPEAHIVNVSSMGGFFPFPGQSIYGASKAAVKIMTEGLRSELADTKVKVSVVFPGATATNITTNSGLDMPMDAEDQEGQALQPSEVARIVIKGMEKNKIWIYTGRDSKMMNFMYKVAPKYATNMVTKRMKHMIEE